MYFSIQLKVKTGLDSAQLSFIKRFGTCFLLLKLLNQIETQVLQQIFFFETGSRLSMGHWVTQLGVANTLFLTENLSSQKNQNKCHTFLITAEIWYLTKY